MREKNDDRLASAARGGGAAGEGGGAGGDADDVAIGRRRVLFASALGFRPFLRLSPPLLVCLSSHRVGPVSVTRLLGFVYPVECGNSFV